MKAIVCAAILLASTAALGMPIEIPYWVTLECQPVNLPTTGHLDALGSLAWFTFGPRYFDVYLGVIDERSQIRFISSADGDLSEVPVPLIGNLELIMLGTQYDDYLLSRIPCRQVAFSGLEGTYQLGLAVVDAGTYDFAFEPSYCDFVVLPQKVWLSDGYRNSMQMVFMDDHWYITDIYLIIDYWWQKWATGAESVGPFDDDYESVQLHPDFRLDDDGCGIYEVQYNRVGDVHVMIEVCPGFALVWAEYEDQYDDWFSHYYAYGTLNCTLYP